MKPGNNANDYMGDSSEAVQGAVEEEAEQTYSDATLPDLIYNWPLEFKNEYNKNLKKNKKLAGGSDYSKEYEKMRVKIYTNIFNTYKTYSKSELAEVERQLNEVFKVYNRSKTTIGDTLLHEVATNIKKNIKEETINKDADPADTISDASQSKLDSINEKGKDTDSTESPIYQLPSKVGGTDIEEQGLEDIITDGEEFLEQGDLEIEQTSLQNFSRTLYNILLALGVVVAVIMGSVLGVKLMTSSVEEQAEVKKLIIPYIVGCVVIFGGFGIWKIMVTILQGI